MITPPFVRKCVVFLGESREGDETPVIVGTALIMQREVPAVPGTRYYYLVTAAHLISDVTKNGCDTVSIRINPNDKTQPAKWIALGGPEKWFTRHEKEDGVVDVAVLPVSSTVRPENDALANYDYDAINIQHIAGPEECAFYSICPGDEIFLTGWFEPHTGKHRNIPIVRVGNVSAMREELVETEIGDMDAYLMEVRSIGGLSGSPAFVNIGGIRGTGIMPSGFLLLGLVYGHYDEEHRRKKIMTTGISEDVNEINVGIAIVVPGDKILAVLGQPAIREPEDAEVMDIVTERLPKPDGTKTQA